MTALAFELPVSLEAHEPPEARGVARDQVRLMVARRSDASLAHRVFRDLPDLLAPGDLLVVNDSATLPAAVAARRDDGSAARVHFATRAPRLDSSWRVVEVRSADGARPLRVPPGERLSLPGGAALELVAPFVSARLMLARFVASDDPVQADRSVERYLDRHGQPIRYGYVSQPWPLETYQNVYANAPGSAEMPSAGRPFTEDLIRRLTARGILLAPITLHAGVSSPETHEPPFPEWFDVPPETATLVREARGRKSPVIAVGTTVVRALETAATRTGTIESRSGWTGLVITAERGVRVVDGLITGWHQPEASHLRMLEALAGEPVLTRSYRAALASGYLWHEFGDSHLILP